MRRTVLLLLACAACAPRATTTTTTTTTTQVGTEVRAVRVTSMRPGGLAAFVAAVPPLEEGGECLRHEEGERHLVILRFARSGEIGRSVALVVDAQGRVTRYSDSRGDLQIHGTGPLTAVMINFDDGTATAMNERSAAPGITLGTAAEALELESLGTPRRMIELVKRQCMGVQG